MADGECLMQAQAPIENPPYPDELSPRSPEISLARSRIDRAQSRTDLLAGIGLRQTTRQ
jgi:hypothetical protein